MKIKKARNLETVEYRLNSLMIKKHFVKFKISKNYKDYQ